MKNMKWLLLVLALLLALHCSFALAEEEPTIIASGECGASGDNLIWQLDSTGILTISGEGNMVDCPTFNSAPWESYIDSITSVVIENGVTNIGDRIFYDCSSLVSIEIPDSVSSIGYYAFYDCSSLASIEIPDGVNNIGTWAFCDCSSLQSIEIPDGISIIESHTFSGCSSLQSIKIPDSVSIIGSDAFSYCYKLKSIKLPEGLTEIGSYAFDASGIKNIEIPDSVSIIASDAFNGCRSLQSIKIPDGVSSIEDDTFFECTKLESVEIPDSVRSIGNRAFWGCDNLVSIDIPKSVESIGNSAFESCDRLTNVEFSEGLSKIGWGAFRYSRELTSIDIPESVSYIAEDTLDHCSTIIIRNKGAMTIEPGAWVSSATIYCYKGSDAETCAIEKGNNIVYLDTMDMSIPLSFNLPEDTKRATGISRTEKAYIIPRQENPQIEWVSSDPAVVSVENGTITTLSQGIATITATCGGVSDSMVITTFEPAVSFDLSESEIWLETDTSTQLTIENIVPEGAKDDFVWEGDSILLEVDDSGMLKANDYDEEGDRIISVRSYNGLTRECLVHVCYSPIRIAFEKNTYALECGKEGQLTANVATKSKSYVNKLVTFSSSNEAVATVNQDGVVIGRSVGTATITATAASGIRAECTVAVWDNNTLLLPENLTEIRAEAFMNSNAQCVILPDGCTSIGEKAFAGSAQLQAVHMPDSVTSIAKDAFEGCESLCFICQSRNAAAAYAEAHGIEYIIE